ncbi:uncharacterized protein GGS22DRAFT_195660 [Annulohypoxylon maeteangense]|uniref:uncharacterized protein n=1 Tax=Annulohypoxylon maeteangense TaxID=1927788 RepID=UPI002007B920|nr:uncharacterized protein GGS22DRAFT_195660 [Annulohypoxylon maeteangense]KAI0882952.1 hypothetical protein GGS22DRAFT_195660 [Annulohypoxylon maeteangense]
MFIRKLVSYWTASIFIMNSSTSEAAPPATMNSSYLFTASVTLGKRYGPIPMVGGGIRVVEPFTGGTIDGPNFHATIEGGHASPIVLNDTTTEKGGSVQYPFIYVYGYTDDGQPFYIQEEGIGNRVSQNTRLIINVGGSHSYLQTSYVIAQMRFIENEGGPTTVAVDCYSIPMIA